MATITTLPAKRGSVFETTLPLRSGKLKRNGSVGSLTLVKRVGSLGLGRPLASACSARTAVSGLSTFCTTASVPSAAGASSRRSGRAPEKWLSANLPSRNVPVSVPVSPSIRRITAETSGPAWRTISCHAASPFELLPTCTFHSPAIDGTCAFAASGGVKRFAANGYGAPRVPREYWPSRRPSFSVASSVVPSSSKLSDSLPLANDPLVDVVLSSPLKNEPFTAVPDPEISKRNGISRAPLLTSTVASHNPATGAVGAAARDGTASSARRAATRAGTLVVMDSPEKTKARKDETFRACSRAERVVPAVYVIIGARVPRTQLRAGRRRLRPSNTSIRNSATRSCLHLYLREPLALSNRCRSDRSVR